MNEDEKIPNGGPISWATRDYYYDYYADDFVLLMF